VGSISKLYKYPYNPLYSFLREKNAIIPAPKIEENDDFLAVLTYYQRKTQQQRIEMSPHVRRAVQRIREEIGSPAKAILAQPHELPERTRMPRRAVPKQPNSVTREQPKRDVPESIPMTSLGDFVQYGKVSKYHAEHPDADVKEVSKHTRVFPSRVATLLRQIRSDCNKTSVRDASEQRATNKQVHQCLENDIEKKYPRRGNLQLFRYKKELSFLCDKCKKEVHSNLRAEWSTKGGKKVVCNGCYGYLLAHSQEQTTRNKPKARKNDISDSPVARARRAGLLGKDRTY